VKSIAAIAVIPARLQSTRLPRKVLADLCGRPLLWHVWNRVIQAKRLAGVYIATDAEEVCTAVEAWGGRVLLTSPDCQSGTERIASVLDDLDGDFILNVQGDEPLVDPCLLDEMVQTWEQDNGDILTPVFQIKELETLRNPNVVKVVRTANGRALYFSRHPIPYVRDHPQERWLEFSSFWGHVGIYGYRRQVLMNYPGLAASPLENVERLEQLRFLEAGYNIQTLETAYHPVAVDTAADLERVRQILTGLSEAAG
jgi:3-deoxy-manno-octulosonate cytidylyltransferase (CMP-KDO synthetase)